jgi:hypothetical protein
MALLGIFEFLAVMLCLVFFGGLALLIVGLSLRKKKLWISGIVILSVSLILFAVTGGMIEYFKTREYSYNEYTYGQPEAVASDTQYYQENTDSTGLIPESLVEQLSRKYQEPISGTCNISGLSCVMPLFIDPRLDAMNVKANNFTIDNNDGGNIVVSIELKAQAAKKMKCMFNAWDKNGLPLIEHAMKIQMDEGGMGSIEFVLNSNTTVNEWRYTTLNFID